MRRQIGIMGGTFNPIHMGHLLLAEHAREELQLDEILFMPSGVSYMKKQDSILPADKRLHMVELAVGDNPFFSVSDMEIQKKGNTYTWETLEQLKESNPLCDYTFLMGADSLFHIESWKYPERIFAACRVAVSVRESMNLPDCRKKANELQRKYGADIVILQTDRIDISSTDIRIRRKRNRSIRYLVPEPVRQWIEEQGLYMENTENRVNLR